MEETSQGFIESLILDQHSSTEKRSLGFVHSTEDEPEEKNESELPPLVVDADGLKLLANLPEWEERLPALAVLTPHPGEMSVLTGLDVAEIQNKRLETVEHFARQWGHVVVLKGAHTLIASPDGRTALIPVATPALARAGTGDVLAGLIVGLRAQGLPAFEAAVAGAWIHAHAGLAAEALLGNSACVVAGDVLEVVVDVMADL
jgi:NAD(P)H-hydrate epimerase